MRFLAASLLLATVSSAQVAEHKAVTTWASGGNHFATPADVVYPPVREEQDRRLDMFFGDWHESMPRVAFGNLILRDILTHGDNLAPPSKGAVLQRANSLSYGRLAAGASTVPTKLVGRQEVFYIMDGEGEIVQGGKRVALRKDIAVLMPAEAEFTMTATDSADLTMYVLEDPTPPKFKPIPAMIFVDERKVTVRAPAADSPFTDKGASGHWAHVVRDLFNKRDGMATVGDIITVELNPLSLGEPHPHLPGKEEVWLQMEGTSVAFVGPQLRMQRPGMAYLLRPDGLTQHANINNSNEVVKFLWFNTNTGLSAQPHH